MGKGNAQKSAQARAKNAAKADAEGKGGGGAKGMADRTALKTFVLCALCRTQFPTGQALVQYQSHIDSKHPKETLASCFGPDLVYK